MGMCGGTFYIRWLWGHPQNLSQVFTFFFFSPSPQVFTFFFFSPSPQLRLQLLSILNFEIGNQCQKHAYFIFRKQGRGPGTCMLRYSRGVPPNGLVFHKRIFRQGSHFHQKILKEGPISWKLQKKKKKMLKISCFWGEKKQTWVLIFEKAVKSVIFWVRKILWYG